MYSKKVSIAMKKAAASLGNDLLHFASSKTYFPLKRILVIFSSLSQESSSRHHKLRKRLVVSMKENTNSRCLQAYNRQQLETATVEMSCCL
jgi:hypothetical protein